MHFPIDWAAAEVEFARLVAFDARHFGCERCEFLRAWLALPESRSLVCERGGEIRGFGVIRPCRVGWKIGPLFAEDAAVAETLFLSLAECGAGGEVFIDPPEPNGTAVELARRHGLEPIFETARMYNGPPPKLPLEAIYGITSFELG